MKTIINYKELITIKAKSVSHFKHKMRMKIESKLNKAGFDIDKRFEQWYDRVNDCLVFKQQ